MEGYSEKISPSSFKIVREWAHTMPDVNNVLKGYWKQCFGVIGDFKVNDTINFIFIKDSHDNPGMVLQLKYKEENFYDYILIYSTIICRDNKKLEIVNLYNTFTNFYRTFLSSFDIEPFFSAELADLPRGTKLF